MLEIINLLRILDSRDSNVPVDPLRFKPIILTANKPHPKHHKIITDLQNEKYFFKKILLFNFLLLA